MIGGLTLGSNSGKSQLVLSAWQIQLERIVRPYLEQACADGYGVQVVLLAQTDGRVRDPKVTILAGQKHQP